MGMYQQCENRHGDPAGIGDLKRSDIGCRNDQEQRHQQNYA